MLHHTDYEEWKPLETDEVVDKEKIHISSHGRLKSFKTNEKGHILKFATVRGYKTITLRLESGGRRSFYIHKLVANHFIPNDDSEKKFVLHLDHDKENNQMENLKWATKEEKEKHQQSNPAWRDGITRSAKLTESKVRLIKERIFDPNRKTRMKMIARQFGISEMQLYRIKSGENWGHIKVEIPAEGVEVPQEEGTGEKEA